VNWLRKHLQLPAVDAAGTAQLVADLDSEQFERRQQAGKALEVLGDLALPALRQALKKTPALEVQRRLEELLAKLPHQVLAGEPLRCWRALEVLERNGTRKPGSC
jgi:hypothetical protein